MIEADDLKDLLGGSLEPPESSGNKKSLEGPSASLEPSGIPEADQRSVRSSTVPLDPSDDEVPLELQILEQVLANKPLKAISKSVGLPVGSLKEYLARPEIQERLQEMRDTMNVMHQVTIQDTLSKILEARIESLGEDETFSDLTKKDTLDVLRVFSDIVNNIEKNKKKDDEKDVFLNIYTQVLSK